MQSEVTTAADLPLTVSVPEAGSWIGLSPNSSYIAARRGEIPTIRFGRRLRVPTAAWLERLDTPDEPRTGVQG